MWNMQSAAEFCIQLEEIASRHQYHVALTGGCLYRQQLRKDVDVLFYPHNEKTSSAVLANNLWAEVVALSESHAVYSDVGTLRLLDGRRLDVLFRGRFVPDVSQGSNVAYPPGSGRT